VRLKGATFVQASRILELVGEDGAARELTPSTRARFNPGVRGNLHEKDR